MLDPDKMTREECFDQLDKVAADWGIPYIDRAKCKASDAQVRALLKRTIKQGEKLGSMQ